MAATAMAAAVSATTIVSSATALCADKRTEPEADAESIDDGGWRINRRRDLIDWWRIGGRCTGIALAIGSEIVSRRTNRCLR
jgi:hypothetical protein